jgi:hypothetical protein
VAFSFFALFQLGCCIALSAAPKWKIQYLYDQPGSNFEIRDLACPSAQRCIGAGVITDRKEHQQGAVVVSSDSGSHWSLYEVKEQPVSLFFLDETLGWMVTDHGLWSTVEGGRSWIKVENRKGILRTQFLDPQHGYIVGSASLLDETSDGGKTWTPRPEAATASANPRAVNYESITFAGPHGIIIGEIDPDGPPAKKLNRPVEAGRQPEPERKHLVVIETSDKGKQWTTGYIPLEGALGQLRISPQGFALALVVYTDPHAPLASAVFQMTLGSSSRMIFGERDRAVTDVSLLANNSAVLVAVEPPGVSPQVPIPGKLKIFQSSNLKVWQEMDVDYRAVAQDAVLAAVDPAHIWVATDTGAILGLMRQD